ncbi:MAG TPA: carboxymuconolactone decarboxylase family protein [Ignavibacteriaceae bacterium]|jgi:AhpD family alkylhydroperoxidase|nr:MAG: Carboxymuconolactone decarboxylase family protein [Ignavibacteria bacterium ADurb.Bin266]OQY71920.1 MAG: carboxymuconolactone decarboxylase [Ignavibacteriales bacterium UTCHB2]HQF42856.1 carboxymuconolactone decarboxylase family protein [Ignavibacteriaceae bacterium]HQI39557.1 carboxymuconolactone decarboxylase family protein [Ignavibacteriaceae bacterium]HQJ45663.1 carboxymuconolactone decarboxylase family protein [Ignavibacteriaceae bacterium]
MRINWYKTSPEGYKAMLELEKVVHKSSLDPKLLELIKTRASQINGCAHCLEMHTKDAIAIGESEQRLFVVAAWREAPSFYSEKERVALAWCESLTNISSKGAPENLYKELQKHFTDKEIVELTLAIIAINGWNRLAVSFHSEVGNYVSNRSKTK